MEYRDLIGVPFKMRGRDTDGLDCYGLVMELYKRLGIELTDYEYEDSPRITGDDIFSRCQGREFCEVNGSPREGDVVVLGRGLGTHCGVFVKGNRVVHSWNPLGVVSTPWKVMKPFVVGVHRHPCLA